MDFTDKTLLNEMTYCVIDDTIHIIINIFNDASF